MLWLLGSISHAARLDVPAMYATVNDALDAAVAGDQIVVDGAAGTPFVETASLTVAVTLRGVNGAVLEAPGAGAPAVSVNAPGAVVELRDVTLSGAGVSRALRVFAGTARLEDVVVRDAFDPQGGGAIRVETGATALSLIGGEVRDGRSDQVGGCLSVLGGDLTVERTRFTACHSGVSGGAVDHQGSGALVVRDAVFTDNVAAQRGGALNLRSSGAATLETSSFVHNTSTADRGGGAVYAEGPPSVDILDCTFRDNRADGTEGGGAVYHRSGDLRVVRGLFCGNAAQVDGGAVRVHGGTARLSASLFLHNTAGDQGGAIWSGAGTTAPHGAFHENSAGATGPAWHAENPVAAIEDGVVVGHPGGIAAWAVDNGSSASTTNWWSNAGGDFRQPEFADGGGNQLLQDPLLVLTSGSCDPRAFVPPAGSPLLGAGTGGSDLGPFGGPDSWATVDRDGDGATIVDDCDDDDPARSPRFAEVPSDGIDQDCDGGEACFTDPDGDGLGSEPTAPGDLACTGFLPADDDPCPLDPDNDADQDNLCADQDPCPANPSQTCTGESGTTGDTAATAVTGDTGVTGDTALAGHTGRTVTETGTPTDDGPTDGPADGVDGVDGTEPTDRTGGLGLPLDPGCGCRTGSAAPPLAGAIAALMLARRRRTAIR
jgi:MYXO-CTERM domain-containing protein